MNAPNTARIATAATAPGPEVASAEAVVLAAPTRPRALYWVVLATACLLGVGVRLYALFDGFWFDEILSYMTASRADSALDVFLIANDNNHILNTLWLYISGTGNSWAWYRSPAFILGTFSLYLVYTLGKRENYAFAAVATVLYAISFPMVIYSSEARGYSLAIFFQLLSIYITHDLRKGITPVRAIVYQASIIFGFLSHLTFVYHWVGAAAFAAMQLPRLPLKNKAKTILLLNLFPFLSLLTIYLVFIKNLVYFGNPPTTFLSAIGETASIFFSTYHLGLPTWTAIALFIVSMAAGISASIKHRSNTSILFILPLLVSSVHLCFFATMSIHPRYFIILFVPSLLMLTHAITFYFRKNRGLTIASALCFTALISLNLYQIYLFSSSGRSPYIPTLNKIINSRQSEEITFAFQPFNNQRNKICIDFVSSYALSKPNIRYLPPDAILEGTAQYYVANAFEKSEHWNDFTVVNQDTGHSHTYDLVDLSRSYGPSGWGWALYERRETP